MPGLERVVACAVSECFLGAVNDSLSKALFGEASMRDHIFEAVPCLHDSSRHHAHEGIPDGRVAANGLGLTGGLLFVCCLDGCRLVLVSEGKDCVAVGD